VNENQIPQTAAPVSAPTQGQANPSHSSSLFDEDITIREPNAEGLPATPCLADTFEGLGAVLKVVGVPELTAAHGRRFGKRVQSALNGHTVIEIDLSATTSIDCSGLGALIAIRNLTRERNGVVRLMNPTARVRQLLDLMRAGQIFEIVKTDLTSSRG
jgi:anti-anti-sigma factor